MDSSSEHDLLLPSSSTRTRPQHPPRDRGYMVYIIFYVLGIGALLPWNFFSTATQYFTYKLKDQNVTEPEFMSGNFTSNHLQHMFESYLSIAAMIPNVIFMFLNTAVTKIIPLRARIIIGTCLMIILFIITTALTKVDSDAWETSFFIITLITIVLMNAASAVLQGGVFGLAAVFPKEYTQSVMGGMGAGGTIAAIAYILALWLGSDPLTSGFGYFLTAAGILVVSLVGYCSLSCCGFALYHMETLKQGRSKSDIEDSSPSIQAKTNTGVGTGLVAVLKKIWVYAYCVLILFTVTISCYPAVASSIKSQSFREGSEDNPWAETYFTPVICFLAFNFCDLLGRTMPGFFTNWPGDKSKWLPILCTLRVLFIPLFLLCNVQPRGNLPVVFKADYFPAIITVLFAMSNGYLGTLAMMYGPKRVDIHELETAGAMMSFFLALGLAIGSLCSWCLLRLIIL